MTMPSHTVKCTSMGVGAHVLHQVELVPAAHDTILNQLQSPSQGLPCVNNTAFCLVGVLCSHTKPYPHSQSSLSWYVQARQSSQSARQPINWIIRRDMCCVDNKLSAHLKASLAIQLKKLLQCAELAGTHHFV